MNTSINQDSKKPISIAKLKTLGIGAIREL